jgi:hypothetical protein
VMFSNENGPNGNRLCVFSLNDIFFMYMDWQKGRTNLMIGDILMDLWDFIAHDFWWCCYAVRNKFIQAKKKIIQMRFCCHFLHNFNFFLCASPTRTLDLNLFISCSNFNCKRPFLKH